MSDTEEGKRVADAIVEQKNRNHYSNSDIAILYRTNAQSRVFEEYLRRYNITYQVFGGTSFYQRKEVKDLLAYLRLTINQKDEEALKRIINYPKRAIGKATVDKILALAASTDQTMWDCLDKVEVAKRAKGQLKGFKLMMETFIQKVATTDAYELATFVARQTGLITKLKADTTIEGLGRLENITSLLDGIKEFVENDEVIEGAIYG